MKNNETKKIMVVNCGSSSLKFRLIEMPSEKLLLKVYLKVLVRKIHQIILLQNIKLVITLAMLQSDHTLKPVQILLDYLMKNKIISSYSEIDGVGHRVVQGGKYFSKS